MNASREKLRVGGHPVYAAYFEGDMGYRIDMTEGVAKGDEPESLYMVTSGTHYNTECCAPPAACPGALRMLPLTPPLSLRCRPYCRCCGGHGSDCSRLRATLRRLRLRQRGEQQR